MHPTPPIITTPATPQMLGGGSFMVGTQALFYFYFNDVSGQMYDPSDFTIVITDPSGNVVQSSTTEALDKLTTGTFVYLWNIPSSSVTGKYTVTLTYIVETVNGPDTETFVEDFVVVESGPGALTIRKVASRGYLESLIGYIQRIPVWHEPARFNNARTRAKLSFGKWNQSAGEEIYVNGNKYESGYSVDYWRGYIDFSAPLSVYDEVLVSYNFRWFTDEELDGFIEQGVNIVNTYPPQTTYTINNIEDRWIISAEYAAATDVIRRWMADILFQEPAKIFGGPQRASEIFGHLDSLKKNYEEMLFKLLDMKKFGPYAGLTKTVTAPEYTLPGGRSRWFRYLFKGG